MQKLLTLKDTAALLSVSLEYVKKLRREGRLKVVKLGRAVRVSQEELERLCREGISK